jgi:hypothetical protein
MGDPPQSTQWVRVGTSAMGHSRIYPRAYEPVPPLTQLWPENEAIKIGGQISYHGGPPVVPPMEEANGT